MNDELDDLRRANPVRGGESYPEYPTVRERIRMKDKKKTQIRERLMIAGVCCGLAASVATMSVVRSNDSTLPVIRLSASREAAMSATADAKMSSWAGGRLVLEAGVEIPAGEADVWRTGEIKKSDVEKLAKRLGIDPSSADITETAEHSFQGKNLFVGSNGTWSYWVDSWGAGTSVSSTACAPVEASEKTDCVENDNSSPQPTPAAKNLPSEKEAVAIAEKLIGDEHVVVAESSRDDWSVQVTATLDVANGAELPSWGYVSIGENGRVLGAGGVIGGVHRVGSYPTISASEAVRRVQMWPMMMARDASSSGVVSTLPGCEEPCEEVMPMPAEVEPDASDATVAPVDPTVVSDEPVVDVFPTDGEPQDIIAVKVYRSVMLVTDVDGRGWIVPAYSYETRDGAVFQAVALDDSQYDTNATTAPNIMSTIAEPARGADAVEPKLVDDAVLKKVIGMSEADAVTYILKEGFVARTTERDGEGLAVTDDYSESRVNLVVKADKVVGASRG
jgi:hypothetical protein